jgi:hypothetical protein
MSGQTGNVGLRQPLQQQQQRRANPFAAASAAAAVNEAIGGCVAAVESPADPAGAADAVPDFSSSSRRTDQDKLRDCHSSKCASRTSSSSSRSGSKLLGSQSVVAAAFRGSSSSKRSAAAAVDDELVQRAYLPHLQQLQLKHCSLVGISLDDIITKPLVSHTCQHVTLLIVD